MNKKTVFFCSECGNETPKWQGQCPQCGSWNTLVEQPASATNKLRTQEKNKTNFRIAEAVHLSDIQTGEEIRFGTGLAELDRVLGGGAVIGSVVLIGGAPGIGKSTLMLQICDTLCRTYSVLYVTGEESRSQLKMRADRLGVNSRDMYVLSDSHLENVINSYEDLKPDIIIIDSIQTMLSYETDSLSGSISQVKACTSALIQLAKSNNVTVFVIGHINKEGAIAGPKVLEHMVDCVLYFEGERAAAYRILRAAKNRFGSTDEIGVFEMTSDGLTEISSPSEMLLYGRPHNQPGSCVTCVMEGTRPILAEVQALVAKSNFNVPRRTSNGIDYNRAMLLLAVLEKRGGLNVSQSDAYINVTGGLTINEPCSDLSVIMALVSSFIDKPLPEDMAVFGEVGLTGEIRTVSYVNQRLSELYRMGFRKCVLPASGKQKYDELPGMELIIVKNISEALKIFRN